MFFALDFLSYSRGPGWRGKSRENGVDLCLASRECLVTESGVECVSAAWQNALHVKSSQDTISEKRQTAHIFSHFFCQFSPVLPERPIVLLHGLNLRVLVGVFFLFHCGRDAFVCAFIAFLFFFFLKALTPQKCANASVGYLDICHLCSS